MPPMHWLRPVAQSSARHPPAEADDEQRVQRHIRYAGGNRRRQAELWLFSGRQKV